VFQSRVEKISVADSATLGAALRAASAMDYFRRNEICAKFAVVSETIEPDKATAGIYDDMLVKFAELEKK
jgi:sugar (pentulose or hexulose) kinase